MAQTPCVRKKDAGSIMIDFTPSAAKLAGAVIIQNHLVAIALVDLEANRKGAVCVQGIFDVPKDSSNLTDAWTPLYWDADGDPVGGDSGSGAFTATATGNTFAGWGLEVAGAGVGTVRLLLCSALSVAVTTIDALTDVGTIAHAAGALIVGDGSKFEEVALSGDATLAANGALTLNAAHQEQIVMVPIAALAANADLTAIEVFAHPRANTLVSLGYLAAGSDFGTVNDANTSVFALTDGAGNAIVTKTFNTATQPTANALNDLGSLDGTHKVLTAAETVKLAITNGASAKTPAGYLVIRTIPTNA